MLREADSVTRMRGDLRPSTIKAELCKVLYSHSEAHPEDPRDDSASGDIDEYGENFVETRTAKSSHNL